MTAGMIPSFTSEKREHRVGRRDRDVGARDEAGAAAERVAVHAHDDRRRAAVDRLEHHPVEAQRVLDVLLVAEVDRARASTRRRRRRRSSGPRPRARRARASPTSAKRLGSSAISSASKALRRSGRASVTRRTIAVALDPQRLHGCAVVEFDAHAARSARRRADAAPRRRRGARRGRVRAVRRLPAPGGVDGILALGTTGEGILLSRRRAPARGGALPRRPRCR